MAGLRCMLERANCWSHITHDLRECQQEDTVIKDYGIFFPFLAHLLLIHSKCASRIDPDSIASPLLLLKVAGARLFCFWNIKQTSEMVLVYRIREGDVRNRQPMASSGVAAVQSALLVLRTKTVKITVTWLMTRMPPMATDCSLTKSADGHYRRIR